MTSEPSSTRSVTSAIAPSTVSASKCLPSGSPRSGKKWSQLNRQSTPSASASAPRAAHGGPIGVLGLELRRDADRRHAPQYSKRRRPPDGGGLLHGHRRSVRHDVQRAFARRGRTTYVGAPSSRALSQFTAVTHQRSPSRSPGTPYCGAGRDEVVADQALVLEELPGDHGADRVAPEILRTGRAAAVPVEAGQRIAPHSSRLPLSRCDGDRPDHRRRRASAASASSS